MTDDTDADEEDNREMTFVGCEVEKSTSDEWSKFVEESSEYKSKAQLIRSGVDRIISEDDKDVMREIDRLRDGVYTVLQEVEEARNDIDDVGEEIDNAEDIAEETVDLMNRIEDKVDSEDIAEDE
jgi:hypothetical protein